MTILFENGLIHSSSLFILVFLSFVCPVACEQKCSAVVPLAIVVIILAMTSCMLLVILLWGYTQRHRRRSTARTHRVPAARTSRVLETESFFTNMGMQATESAGSTPRVTPTTSQVSLSRYPVPGTSKYPPQYPRGETPEGPSHTYGYSRGAPRGVHEPTKYGPGMSRHTSQSSGMQRY